MANYTRKLFEITITMTNGATFEVKDTIECPLASQAIASLSRGGTATVYVDNDEYVIFASGVASIKINTTDSEEIPLPDPSC